MKIDRHELRADTMVEGADDTAERIERLKTEMRDMEREYEREREELAGAGSLVSARSVSSDIEHEERVNVHERISSVRQAISDLKEERSRLGIGQEGVDRRFFQRFTSQAGEKPTGQDARAEEREQGKARHCELREEPQFARVGEDDGQREPVTVPLSAESSYLRYSVKQNFSSIARHHKEVAHELSNSSAQFGVRTSSAYILNSTLYSVCIQ